MSDTLHFRAFVKSDHMKTTTWSTCTSFCNSQKYFLLPPKFTSTVSAPYIRVGLDIPVLNVINFKLLDYWIKRKIIKLQVIQKPSYSQQFYPPFQLYLLTKKIKFSPHILDSPVTLENSLNSGRATRKCIWRWKPPSPMGGLLLLRGQLRTRTEHYKIELPRLWGPWFLLVLHVLGSCFFSSSLILS